MVTSTSIRLKPVLYSADGPHFFGIASSACSTYWLVNPRHSAQFDLMQRALLVADPVASSKNVDAARLVDLPFPK